MTTLNRLMDWYLSNCDEDWEHMYGINIRTLDNPGWTMEVDLTGTELEGRTFSTVHSERSDQDWIHCHVESKDGKSLFRGNGGPKNLDEVMLIFLEWADSESGDGANL